MDILDLLSTVTAAAAAFLLSFLITPAVRVLAFSIGALDIPKDDRRMHKTPMPLIGGLAIFLSFSVTALIFLKLTPLTVTLTLGGLALVILGIFDDIYDVNALIKLSVHLVVSLFAVVKGIVIENVNVFGHGIELGVFSIPVTVLWIVILINAFNLIDGLDGLSCGISSISCLSLFIISAMMGNLTCAMLAAVLFGACSGFLPFNYNPAKIFMGDTGAYFLGFALAVISIEGLFKVSTIISFLLPITIFALPLFDTAFAFLRRIIRGSNPFAPDKRHLHHRLIALGLSQRQTVLILYSVSALFGVIAIVHSDVLFAEDKLYKALVLFIVSVIVCAVDLALLKRNKLCDTSRDTKRDKNDTSR